MKKLIVETKNAPIGIVSSILATWSKLAELVDKEVTLTRGCDLEWELVLRHISRTAGFSMKDGADYWVSYSAVKMIFPAHVEGVEYSFGSQVVNVPLTVVEEVMIYDDNTFSWHDSDKARPEEDTGTIKRLAEAVSKGKLVTESGVHHYRKNWIPKIGE